MTTALMTIPAAPVTDASRNKNQTKPKALFLSLTGLLALMRDYLVTPDDLINGLFFFRFDKKRTVLDFKQSRYQQVFPEGISHAEKYQLHDKMLMYIEKANEQGRVHWGHKAIDPVSELNMLLMMFGRNPLPSFDADRRGNFKDVERRLILSQKDGLNNGLEVFWHNTQGAFTLARIKLRRNMAYLDTKNKHTDETKSKVGS